MSTKQNKFYETLRQTQANTFSDGLNMDLHPLTTPNTILTDCVNGTMITYNDNEFVLQNERGNSKIPIGDDHVKLSQGFIPVGMKEHNGILYIVSHNPQTKECEIGTYPSPKQSDNYISSENKVVLELNNEEYWYSEINTELIYYENDFFITPLDKYDLTISNVNSLFILDHYILSEDGELSKIKLQTGKNQRFSHTGKVKLGYKYRPYFIESLTLNSSFNKGSKSSLKATVNISDEELILKLNAEEAEIGIQIESTYVGENDETDEYTENIIITDFQKYDTLQGNCEYDITYYPENGYDWETGKLNGEYTEKKFIITPFIKIDGYTLYMDTLKEHKIFRLDQLTTSPSYFTKFKYQGTTDENTDNLYLNIEAQLDMSIYDPEFVEGKTYAYDLTCNTKLSKIDQNGNLVNPKFAQIFPAAKSEVVFYTKNSDIPQNGLGYVYDEKSGKYWYKLPSSTAVLDEEGSENNWLFGSGYDEELGDICLKSETDKQATHVMWTEIGGNKKAILLKDNKILIELPIKTDEGCADFSSITDYTTDSRVNVEFKDGKLNYLFLNVAVEKDSIYLFTIRHSIENETRVFSFFIVTSKNMLDKYAEDLVLRMDKLGISDWYAVPSLTDEDITIKCIKSQNSHEKLENTTEDCARKQAKEDFLSYDDWVQKDEIPTITQTNKYKIELAIPDGLILKISDLTEGTYNGLYHSISYTRTKIWNLKKDDPEKAATWNRNYRRVYLDDKFKGIDWECMTLRVPYMYYGVQKGPYISDGIEWKRQGYTQINNSILAHEGQAFYLNGIRYMPNSMLNDTGYLTARTEEIHKVRGGQCGGLVGKWRNVLGWTRTGNSGLSGALSFMNLAGCMHFGKITCGEYVMYNNLPETHRIWMIGKKDNVYVLVGIEPDLNTYDKEYYKSVWNTLLKHSYIYEKLPATQTLYQYKWQKDGEGIASVETNESNTTIKMNYKCYPKECLFYNNEGVRWNIQSWANINYNNIPVSSKEIVINDDANQDNINTIYLQELGTALNNYNSDIDSVNSVSEDTVFTDFKDKKMIYDDDISFSVTEFSDDEKSALKTDTLYYDKQNNKIYIKDTPDSIDSFNYSGGCISPLKWNYKKSDFICKWSWDIIDKVGKYKSLWYYRSKKWN